MGIGSAYVIGFIAVIIVCAMTFWVTKKAYSRKWDEEE